VKSQVMVWIAAATLHEQAKAPIQRKELIDETLRLFPKVNPLTLARYVDHYTNTASSLPYSFAYLHKVGPASYRLTQPSDENPLDKPRWPRVDDVDVEYRTLWKRWSSWQQNSRLEEDDSEEAVVSDIQDEGLSKQEAGVDSTLSTYREVMLEHLLLGELMRRLWPVPLEISKPQVDASGYDLILECKGVLRHVQLKTSKVEAATASVNVHVELWKRQGGCVIWSRFDPASLVFTEFWWVGGPSQPLPPVDELDVARHSKGNSKGDKLARPLQRVMPKNAFKRLTSVDELLEHLFGDEALGGP